MRKVSLVIMVLFIMMAIPFAITGQILPVVFNLIIATVFLSIYVKLPSAG
jgi:hypothetical protein